MLRPILIRRFSHPTKRRFAVNPDAFASMRSRLFPATLCLQQQIILLAVCHALPRFSVLIHADRPASVVIDDELESHGSSFDARLQSGTAKIQILPPPH